MDEYAPACDSCGEYYIDKIVVHATEKSTGERIQDVDIYLKFVGKLDIPIPESTPEELAE